MTPSPRAGEGRGGGATALGEAAPRIPGRTTEARRAPPMSEALDASTRAAFAGAFGGDPAVLARAPGRVELLGNHTDYHGGLVLAAAIDRDTVAVGRPRDGSEAAVFAANLGQSDRFDRGAIDRGEP